MNTEIDEGTLYSSIIIGEGEPVSPARLKKHFEYDPHLDRSSIHLPQAKSGRYLVTKEKAGPYFQEWVQLLQCPASVTRYQESMFA